MQHEQPSAQVTESFTTPNPSVPSQPYNVIIRSLSHGYYVEVGCKGFAIEHVETLLSKVRAYLIDPTGTEKKFYEGTLFKH